MKVAWKVSNFLTALFILFSLVFTSPAPVSAQAQPPEAAQQPARWMQLDLSEQQIRISPGHSAVQPATVNPAPVLQTAGWTTIATQDFEGAWPGTWLTADNDGTTNGEYIWAPTTAKPHNGSKSAWMARGGANGFEPGTNPGYPSGLNSAVGYRFSTVGATAAQVTFWYFLDADACQGQGQGDCFTLSVNDGTSQGWDAVPYDVTQGSWQQMTLDLSNVGGSNVLGLANVTIAFGFSSDTTGNTGQGAFLDDIVIEKQTGTAPTCYTLTTGVSPAGSGTVAADKTGDCPGDATKYAAGTVVNLTATPTDQYLTLDSWTGADATTGNPVAVTMSGDKTVTANFTDTAPCYTLAATASPAEGGTVTSTPERNCNNKGGYRAGTLVTLTATKNAGYDFINWTGDITGAQSSLQVTMDGNKTTTANFQIQCFTLTKNGDPTEGGTITANPTENCPNNAAKYKYGEVVSLTANQASTYLFDSWGAGVTDILNNTAKVTMTQDRSVTAKFIVAPPCYTLTINASAGGSVAASPAANCKNGPGYSSGTVVTLTATPDTGNGTSWSGVDSSNGNTATVTMNSTKTVTATFSKLCYALTANASPASTGTFSFNPTPNCGDNYQHGTSVTVTANPATGYQFSSWSGSGTVNNNRITVTMDSAKSVTATFVKQCYAVTYSADPSTDYGTVSASPAYNCTGGYEHGTQVQFTAAPKTGYEFVNWTGITGTASPVTVTVTGPLTVVGHFQRQCFILTRTSSPVAGGSINASPTPTCPTDATKYAYGETVNLTAAPSTDYTFTSWSTNVNNQIGLTGTVSMTKDQEVIASFKVNPKCYTLTQNVSPAGDGDVQADPGPNCEDGVRYLEGTEVKLTPVPATGKAFNGWTGAIQGMDIPGIVTMTQDRAVTANFTTACYTLTTAAVPSAGGSITATAPDCGTKYTYGKQVTLTAHANTGYVFDAWAGNFEAQDLNTATVTMNGDRSVSANFTRLCYQLTTGASPSGSGQVTASPGPNCAADDTLYDYGQVVTLTAAPTTGYAFGSWTGAAGSTGTTTVTMTGEHSVTANFSRLCYALDAAANPAAGGSVTPVIQSGKPCQADATKYDYGTQLTLTYTKNTGYDFTGWTLDGSASGAADSLPVTMTANHTVRAGFALRCFALTTTANPASGGDIHAVPAPNCGDQYTYGTDVTLTALPKTGFDFTGWSGALTGMTNPAVVSMTEDRSVTAGFAQQCFTLAIAADPAAGGTVTPDFAPNCGDKYAYGTTVQLTAAANQGYEFTGWTGALTGKTNPSTVEMTANRTVTGKFLFVDFATLSGVVKVEGRLIKGAVVHVGDLSATTNAYGKYTLQVRSGIEITPTVTHPYYQFNAGKTQTPVAKTKITQNWSTGSVIVRGRITEVLYGTTQVEPVADVKLTAGKVFAYTDANGYYELTVPDSAVTSLASFSVVAKKANYTFTPASRAINSKLNQATLDTRNFTAVRKNYTISGKVTLPDGKTPVAGVEIKAGSGTSTKKTTTNAYGNYSLSFPWGTTISRTAWKYGYSFPALADIALGQALSKGNNIIATKLLRLNSITGTLTSITTGKLIPYAAVTLTYQDHVIAKTQTNAKGAYAFKNLVTDAGYLVKVSKNNFFFTNGVDDPAPIASQVVDLAVDGDGKPVPGQAPFFGIWWGTIKGTVSGLKSATITVMVEDGQNPAYPMTITLNKYGQYAYKPLPEGTYKLTPQPFTVQVNATTSYTYTFVPADRTVTLKYGTTVIYANFKAVKTITTTP